MNALTNDAGLSLSMAVWLAHDTYTDGSEEHQGKNLISATSLLKPTRQFVLSKRLTPANVQTDVTDLIASRLGHAVHDSIENAWTHGYAQALKRLGYPEKMIEKVRINPETVEPGDIPIYLEQRAFRTLKLPNLEVVISGKFDQVINGEGNDTKTTSVYTYLNNTNEDYYIKQGSMYRWMSPDKITSDIWRIQHVFTDWQRSQIKINPKYPSHRVKEVTYNLMSLRETENWIRSKVNEIIANQSLPETEIIRCSPEDLWMSEPVYKYYADPKKAQAGGRSSKNFDNYPDAMMHQSKAGKGVVLSVPGQPKRCAYCEAFSICSQKDEYEHA